ncbi:MAG: hypothetical protein P4M02_09860, partial [Clostridia bacterium]|nr:hypothetical protein [Clostridia bacterium]
GLWNASFILNGWWTLFLIVPAIAGIITTGPRFGNIFLLVLGVWLFLDSQGWLGKEGWPLLLGFILIAAGISVMTGSGHTHHRHHHGDGDESRPEENRKD